MQKSFSDYFIGKCKESLLSYKLFNSYDIEQEAKILKVLKKYYTKLTFDQVMKSLALERMIIADCIVELNNATIEKLIATASNTQHFDMNDDRAEILKFIEVGIFSFFIKQAKPGDLMYVIGSDLALTLGKQAISTTIDGSDSFDGMRGDTYRGKLEIFGNVIKFYSTLFNDDTQVLLFCGKSLHDCTVQKITLKIFD